MLTENIATINNVKARYIIHKLSSIIIIDLTKCNIHRRYEIDPHKYKNNV